MAFPTIFVTTVGNFNGRFKDTKAFIEALYIEAGGEGYLDQL
jgi:hypothetical protein